MRMILGPGLFSRLKAVQQLDALDIETYVGLHRSIVHSVSGQPEGDTAAQVPQRGEATSLLRGFLTSATGECCIDGRVLTV